MALGKIGGPSCTSEAHMQELSKSELHDRSDDTCIDFDRKPLLGGMSLKENCDEWYLRRVLCRFLGDDDVEGKMRVLSLLQGLGKCPEIPCADYGGGVVSIDLEAARAFLEARFRMQCAVQSIQGDGGGFKAGVSAADDDLINSLVRSSHSLTAYCDHEISSRERSDADAMDIEAAASSADVLRVQALADPRVGLSLKRSQGLRTANEALQDERRGDLRDEESMFREAADAGTGAGSEAIPSAVATSRENSLKRRRSCLSHFHGITTHDWKRMLRRAGVLFENHVVFEELRGILTVYLENLAYVAQSLLSHRRGRDLVTVSDVVSARPQGPTLLGFGSRIETKYVWVESIYRALARVHEGMEIDPKALAVLVDMSTHLLDVLISSAREFAIRMHQHEGPRVVVEESDEFLEFDDRAEGYVDVPVGSNNAAGYMCALSARLYLHEEVAGVHMQFSCVLHF